MIRPIEVLLSLLELEQADNIRNLIDSIGADSDPFLLGLLYLGAIGWLVRRYRIRFLLKAENLSLGLGAGDVLARFLGGLFMVMIGVLLALARAAGRSHYRW